MTKDGTGTGTGPFDYERTKSFDFKLVMIGGSILCFIALLSSIFPLIDVIMTILLILVAITAVGIIIGRFLKDRRLDYEAFYGPIDPDEEIPPSSLKKEY